ncbi:MAG: pantoate--beta-alanine ligase [Fimbriimonadaceae bacterium]
MRLVTEFSELPVAVGRRGLVPTMGALHAGHCSLIEAAHGLADEVVVSIFVNPAQFRPGEDFQKYPRTPEHDLQLCEDARVDYVFMPSVATMYPLGYSAVTVHVDAVGDRWEGALRPGHFDGVATVVAQLWLGISPKVAVFSVKDLQQCAVLGKLARALRLGVELHFAPTLRDADGLALSSRNRYLSPTERSIAPQLYGALMNAKQLLRAEGEADASTILSQVGNSLDSRFELQYMAIVNRETMEATNTSDRSAWLIAAVRLGTTRLIDNIALHG